MLTTDQALLVVVSILLTAWFSYELITIWKPLGVQWIYFAIILYAVIAFVIPKISGQAYRPSITVQVLFALGIVMIRLYKKRKPA